MYTVIETVFDTVTEETKEKNTFPHPTCPHAHTHTHTRSGITIIMNNV